MSGESPTVGIVGLGLIGGSIAQRWAELGHPVVAWSRSEATRAAASAHGGIAVVDSIEAVVTAADIVVLATPLSVLTQTLDAVAAVALTLDQPPTITDVGSVKTPILTHARAVLPGRAGVFIGGHPMAGTEHAGWASADPNLFDGTRWGLAYDRPLELSRWRAVAEFVLALGAVVVPIGAEEHDAAVAVTSHIPHILAAALAHLLRDGPALARSLVGPSFRSATRVIDGSGRQLGAELATANALVLCRALDALRVDLEDLQRPLRALAGFDDRSVPAGLAMVEGTIRLADGTDPLLTDAERQRLVDEVHARFAEADLADLLAPPTLEATRALSYPDLLRLGRGGGVVTGFTAGGDLAVRVPAVSR